VFKGIDQPKGPCDQADVSRINHGRYCQWWIATFTAVAGESHSSGDKIKYEAP
jgi:hypothetical protein